MSTLRLKASPDWLTAAEVLIEGCVTLPTLDDRVRWMESLCLKLGDSLYPAFLRVLFIVGEQGEPLAQKAVAATLLAALESGRLPSGRKAAWGALGTSATRAYGPIEYLCAWYLHPQGRDALSASGFDRAARALLGLITHDPAAQKLYRARLLALADDPLEGAWSRTGREALRSLAQDWRDAGSIAAGVDAFLHVARNEDTRPQPIMGISTWMGSLG